VLIDWFTVGAQVLNFIVLVWLLKRYLYKPILKAIDVREKRIAAELADAAAKQAAAKKEHDDFQEKNRAFDEQRKALLAKATDEAKAELERLLAEARKAGDELRAKQLSALQGERARFGEAIGRLAGEEVFGIARKALGDLASTDLEERMGAVFTRRLRNLDAEAKAALGAALKDSSAPAQLRSRFDLPDASKAAIQNALNETFSAEIRLKFVNATDGLAGIELTAGGQKLAWSIADYVSALEQKAVALLDARLAPKADPSNAPTPTAAVHTEAN
jgi:F-type H+-transporting ATPase subunit b